MRSSLLVLTAFALLVGACAASSTPRIRVARDLGCTQEQTVVARLPDEPRGDRLERWQVSGCGRTAVYLCTTPVRDCWREGEVRAVAQP